MCGGSASSDGGSSGSGDGGSNNMKDYLPNNYNNQSVPDKLDAIDNALDKTADEYRQLAEDVKSGKKEQGSKEVMRELARLDKIDNKLEEEKRNVLLNARKK